MIKFPHISLFRNVLAYVEHVNTDPEVPEQYRIKSPVTFKGTAKLHGSNCGIVWDLATDTLTAQSRQTTLTPGEDYKGFAAFVAEFESQVRGMFDDMLLATFNDRRPVKLALYGEWVGKGVVGKNKGTAVSLFDPKHWALFAAAAVFEEGEEPVMVSHVLEAIRTEGRIGNVPKSGHWTITIDFSDPASVASGLAYAQTWTDIVDKECPYGARHGLEGKGEGIVWMPQGEYHGREDLMWKIKTEAHSVVEEKLKRERPTVPEDGQEAIAAFVEATVTTNRLEQGIDALEQQGKAATKRYTGDFIKWLTADVERECALQLEDAGLEWGQVSAAVTTKGREYFLGQAT
jgi:hypothetical protein